MNLYWRIAIFVSMGGLLSLLFLRRSSMCAEINITTIADVVQLFPTSVAQITKKTDAALADAKQSIANLIAVPDEKRTFANTAQALDTITSLSDLSVLAPALSLVENLYSDEAMRDAAHDKILEIQNFFIDNISNNVLLYNAFKAYVEGNARTEILTDEQKYFLQETMKDFKHAGLDLPADKQEQVKQLKKDLAALELEFDKNIARDNRTISVDEAGLVGVTPEFKQSLQKNTAGNYILGIDYPTYYHIMENCQNSKTRQELYYTFTNRAYPVNKELLEKIIAKRHELANLLGFSTYAAYDLDNQMVQSPVRAQEFLNGLAIRSAKKACEEVKKFTATVPSSVTLADQGKIYPWDGMYIKNVYKKEHYNIDENKVAEYFPVDSTVKGLLAIYEKFFNLQFNQLPAQSLWDKEVTAIEVTDKEHNQIIGYLLLDLFPRPNKYSHAAHQSVIHVISHDDGTINRGVGVVMANFPKATAHKPALFTLKDVNTFFHEFGHALHGLLGRTHMGSFSGTSVKLDFVEMPSQMLEEWLWNKDILKTVSHHYQTGNPLPDELIDAIIRAHIYDSGMWVNRQLFYANLSLAYYNSGAAVNLDGIMKQLFEQLMPYVASDAQNHDYASFGHLTGYGARYYGYLWSKVFAHDLFHEIKKEGLLNPKVGRRYITEVIGRGGSVDPNELLHNFLGRNPNDAAFLKDMGL